MTGVQTCALPISDRALTARVIADPNARRTDVVRPGCMFPYRAVSGGVLRRTGCVEAAVDLFKIGGMPAAAVTAELVNDDGSLMNGAQARTFAQASDIPLVTIPQLVQHRMSNERAIERVAEAELPTDFGMFRMIGYRSLVDDAEHVALVAGDISSGEDVLVRVHAECLLGDVVCSTRCKCNARLHRSMQRIQDEGRGALIYTRAQAAQGSGLLARITAYSVGDDASSHLPPTDVKNYGTGSQILKDLGFPVLRDVGVTADELETLTDLALDDFFITQAPKPWSRNEVLTAFQNAYALTSQIGRAHV